MNRAVFLDRDGVINPLVYNPNTNDYESPHFPEDFSVYTYALKSLKLIKEMGFLAVVISNQPSYAKGKTTLENIHAIERLLYEFVRENGKLIDDYYYCYHHPNGVVPEYTKVCRCRKPDTLSVELAAAKYNIDKAQSYFIGDQDTDMLCGQKAGLRTIKIMNKHSLHKSGSVKADSAVCDLYAAVLYIQKQMQEA